MAPGRLGLPEGVRVFAWRDYLICYRNEPDAIAILRVVHGSRDLAALF